MTEEEIHLLHLMYLDLASRISDNKINLENFLLFFHKNGFWGESLFREFDQSETQLLSEEQFVCGMCIDVGTQQKYWRPLKNKK